jgi:hypothetical protein
MRTCLATAVVLCLAVCLGSAASSRALNLAQLSDTAGVIVVGKILSVERTIDRDTRLPVKVIKLEVRERLKGEGDSPFNFKQLDDHTIGYTEGEEVLLFLYPTSKLGLTSAVGVEQGTFRMKLNNGVRYLTNRLNNRGLLKDVGAAGAANIQDVEAAKAQTPQGAIQEDRLLDLTRQAVRAAASTGRVK